MNPGDKDYEPEEKEVSNNGSKKKKRNPDRT